MVEQLGKKPFYCEGHRQDDECEKKKALSMLMSANAFQNNEVESESFEESVVDIKVAQYILNNT